MKLIKLNTDASTFDNERMVDQRQTKEYYVSATGSRLFTKQFASYITTLRSPLDKRQSVIMQKRRGTVTGLRVW